MPFGLVQTEVESQNASLKNSRIFFSYSFRQPKGKNMRKILLATTALIGFVAAGAAQAATAPLNVTVGGSIDFVAGAFHESRAAGATNSSSGDFETLYTLDFGIAGKAANGITYGGALALDNYPDMITAIAGNSNNVAIRTADVFMSGAFGKIQLGDSRGATDLAITPSAAGEGQVFGRYIDFLDTGTYSKIFVVGVDGLDHGTNVTYYTPKFGNDTNKVQAAVTFEPYIYDFGSNVALTRKTAATAGVSIYKNVVKGAMAYTGAFKDAKLDASAHIISGVSNVVGSNGKVRDFTAWGVGTQIASNGFTLGVNFADWGHYFTQANQNKSQQQYGAALKYDFCCKLTVGVSYLGGNGYNIFSDLPIAATGSNRNYTKEFNSYGAGGTYTWAPGLTTNVDAVLFGQKTNVTVKNDGYVLLISQKLAF